jgi:transcriptional regulator with XRE-family HTH domain
MAKAFGALLKKLRTEAGLTLREFCARNGLDPGNYSRLERSVYPPPQSHELLEKYATALGIAKGSDQWLDLCDTAAAARGTIPSDLLDNAQLVEKLPVLFRTLRGQPIAPEKLDELAELIRRS